MLRLKPQLLIALMFLVACTLSPPGIPERGSFSRPIAPDSVVFYFKKLEKFKASFDREKVNENLGEYRRSKLSYSDNLLATVVRDTAFDQSLIDSMNLAYHLIPKKVQALCSRENEIVTWIWNADTSVFENNRRAAWTMSDTIYIPSNTPVPQRSGLTRGEYFQTLFLHEYGHIYSKQYFRDLVNTHTVYSTPDGGKTTRITDLDDLPFFKETMENFPTNFSVLMIEDAQISKTYSAAWRPQEYFAESFMHYYFNEQTREFMRENHPKAYAFFLSAELAL